RQVGRRPARSRRGRGTLGRPAGMRAIVGPGILAEWPAERRITMTRREVREIASDSGSVIGTGSLPSLDPQSTPGQPGPDDIRVDGRYRAAEFVRSAVGAPGRDVIVVSATDPMTDAVRDVPWFEPFEVGRSESPRGIVLRLVRGTVASVISLAWLAVVIGI